MTRKQLHFYSVLSATLLATTQAQATNGMLMEGYGPISTAMGGASTAIYEGAAGMVNNPATLGMLPADSARLDISLGNLRPDVKSTVPTTQGMVDAESGGDSYLMPAFGYVRSNGTLVYGAGVFAQGGMGTEYDDTSPLQGARSEVGVGSVLLPLAYKVSDKLTVGGTLEYVWGGMDLIMGMPLFAPDGSAAPGTFADFSSDFGGSNVLGSASGTLLQGFGQLLQSIPQADLPNHAAVFDFSNSSDFTGKATGAGFGARLGLTYEASEQVTLGMSYQSKTAMSDLEGDGSMRVVNGADGSVVAEFPGTYTIKDFQFPEVFNLGVGLKVTDTVMLAMDISQINWSDSMSSFDLNFSTTTQQGPAEADVSMKQDWDDQTVVKVGAAVRATDKLTLRAGLNSANNPVPDAYMNPLFPAIIKDHITTGFSYSISGNSGIAASLVYAPTVTQTNSNTMVTSEHSQTNLQVMYSHKF